ncbi:hypothetical protein GCM10010425_16990 [Streptomyces spororaveus]|uniref:Uncharacterized protein n=1 Tax=Streptomyces spororaveus TaxID=284039 RepID=A0ABQ3T9V1_9ACTN|nr:hypothetical protein Sspor_27200 [Streptomyces spororaveus]
MGCHEIRGGNSEESAQYDGCDAGGDARGQVTVLVLTDIRGWMFDAGVHFSVRPLDGGASAGASEHR